MNLGSNVDAARADRDGSRILLFVPMYNCAPQIPRVVAQLTPDVQDLLDEIILVDNRSTDGTPAAAVAALSASCRIPAKVLINDHNYGLGGSHKVAFNYAVENGFAYCIVLHGDDQGSIRDVVPLLESGAHREVDSLLGARFMPGSRLAGYSFLRTAGNRAFNLIYSLAAGKRIYDLGSGLNVYKTSALEDRAYLACADDLTFNYHMVLRWIAAGKSIRFFPLEWREDDQISNVKLFRQTLRVAEIALSRTFRGKSYLASSYAKRAPGDYTSTISFALGERRAASLA